MKDHNKQEKKSEKELSDSNIKDNESTETICPVKSSSEKETPDNKVKEAAPSEESNSIDSEPMDKKEGTKKINGSTPVIKARITEPLLKEGPPIALVTGKRERKRKKFWDEEDDTLSYAPPPKSSKKNQEKFLIVAPLHPTIFPQETEADVRRGNGKKLEYLLFDMNLEPNLIAKQMVEGYNIPGPGEPIPVDSSNLPDGWEKRVIQRGLVTKKHFDENHLNYSIDSFDFSLDDNLKRLRQIWKQFVIKPNLKPGEKLSSPVPAKLSRKALNAKHLKDSSIPSPLSAANQHLPSYLPRVQSASTNSKLKDNGELSNINSRIPSPSGHDYVHHNSLPDTSLSPGVMSETGQGLRCKINNCGKLFRNDKLLLMHVKHYHPEFRDNFPSISCVPSTDGIEEDEGFSPALGGSKPPQQQEMDASTTSADHLTSEEVVNCTCRRLEEDGLMIQCDLCLCWQHGACLGIFDEDQVPEKHICSICKNPPGSRNPSSRTQIDQDLLKEGKFAVIPSTSSSVSSNQSNLTSKQDAFRKLSDLMADLIGLSKILHSLRIKISVASQKKIVARFSCGVRRGLHRINHPRNLKMRKV
ncbi:PHF20 [Lepeophtheirus salmonis]|uniref:PHF20 n=1 Tax=Lepeophtheirus salmonis TaxID=72036 RepID=A0A7R8CG33_LEPSM|nr:PHF20 [Lepeophtheirus salmonis]CAF2765360.1 PHF20 [Lepeophtheirus salmonis]